MEKTSKAEKQKSIEKKKTKEEKRNKEKEKNGKKWHGPRRAWTRLFHVVKRIRLHVRNAGDAKGLSWQNWSRGFSPSLSPFLSPLSPFHGEDFPPACAFGMTLIARMKHEWNQWNEWNTKEGRMKQMKHEWNARLARSPLASQLRELDARLGVTRNCDGCFDFHCRFPTSLSCSSWLCKNAQGWPRWPGVAAEFVVVCEARKRLLSARTECEASIQIVSARRGNQNLPSPQELRTSRRICYLWPSTDHWRFLVSKWNVYSITCVCVSTESVSWCALMTSLTVVQITKLIFVHFHESKQAKAAHTNKLRMVKKRKEKTELRNEEKCTNQHKI